MVINKVRDILNGVHASEYKGTKSDHHHQQQQQQQQQQQPNSHLSPLHQRDPASHSKDDLSFLDQADVDRMINPEIYSLNDCKPCKIISASLVVFGSLYLCLYRGFKLLKHAESENKPVDIRKGYVQHRKIMSPRFLSTRTHAYLNILAAPILVTAGLNIYYEWFEIPDALEMNAMVYDMFKDLARKSINK